MTKEHKHRLGTRIVVSSAVAFVGAALGMAIEQFYTPVEVTFEELAGAFLLSPLTLTIGGRHYLADASTHVVF
jgi:hypothetical protein